MDFLCCYIPGEKYESILDFFPYIFGKREEKSDRTNTGTITTFGNQVEFDLGKGISEIGRAHG